MLVRIFVRNVLLALQALFAPALTPIPIRVRERGAKERRRTS